MAHSYSSSLIGSSNKGNDTGYDEVAAGCDNLVVILEILTIQATVVSFVNDHRKKDLLAFEHSL